MDATRTETCVAPRHVDASRDFNFDFLRTSSVGGAGGGALQDFFFYFFSLFSRPRASGIGYRVK